MRECVYSVRSLTLSISLSLHRQRCVIIMPAISNFCMSDVSLIDGLNLNRAEMNEGVGCLSLDLIIREKGVKRRSEEEGEEKEASSAQSCDMYCNHCACSQSLSKVIRPCQP